MYERHTRNNFVCPIHRQVGIKKYTGKSKILLVGIHDYLKVPRKEIDVDAIITVSIDLWLVKTF